MKKYIKPIIEDENIEIEDVIAQSNLQDAGGLNNWNPNNDPNAEEFPIV